MNSVLEFLNSHTSCRTFTGKEISAEDEIKIIETAQRSATSSNLQAYSIIGIRDENKKNLLAELSGGQAHVANSSLFLIFCADLHRMEMINKEKKYPFYGEYTEIFIIATVDATLAAGRALQAAQAFGMGGVMVGGIRNNPEEVSKLLSLPKFVYPVMGMSLGYPESDSKLKPRLPLNGIYSKEKYDTEQIYKAIEEYDNTIDELGYLKNREVSPESYPDFDGIYSWSEHTARRMANGNPKAQRAYMLDYLQKRGFLKK